MASKDLTTICLFDVDGTLTPSRNRIQPDMDNFLQELSKKVVVGVVSGSDLSKIAEQLASEGSSNLVEGLLKKYEYVFLENGLVAYHNEELITKQSILKFCGEEKLQEFINFTLQELSKLKLPAKRGNFIEFRSGLINVCPVGRSCSQAERDEFAAYDKEHNVRQNLVQKLKERFPDAGLNFAIGGQISIDVFPIGWDKRFCLEKVIEKGFKTIHFFGDKTQPGGNDHEIFEDERTIGHTVKNPSDTIEQLTKMFF
ncbi:DgyrCDS5658 [Dimorphilus gyrociliatus]|uniref:Phosphomannomutase n=1 Tax=Dimorphilus gyrociliatus TaxID=2664684 RepID=A0A7I8VM54_9ANNE|nr:DgyrCDS5658 [Dimorphilus gyrociliatus]